MQIQYTPADVERFWLHVNKDGPVAAHRPDLGPCWVWKAGRISSGYGMLRAQSVPLLAHRVGYEIQIGPIPERLHICHHCDYRLCVRGLHLFTGTPKENYEDSRRKGRHAHGERHGSKTRPFVPYLKAHPEEALRGEAHPMAKLTSDEVREIRAIGDALSPTELGRRYGVTRSNVYRILGGLTWKSTQTPQCSPEPRRD